MKEIVNYIEKLFSTLPDDFEIEELKNDILKNMEIRYNILRRQEKTIDEATKQTISEFHYVEEIVKNMKPNSDQQKNSSHRNQSEPPIRFKGTRPYRSKNHKEKTDYSKTSTRAFVKESSSFSNIQSSSLSEQEMHKTDKTEVETFLNIRKESGSMIALALLLMFIGFGTMFLIVGLFPTSNPLILFSFAFFLLCLALSLGLLIYHGMKILKFNPFRKPFLIDEKLFDELKTKENNFNKFFMKNIVSGVIILVLSVVPIFLIAALTDISPEGFAVSIPMHIFMVGIAIYLFVQVGFIKLSYRPLLNTPKVYIDYGD